VHQHRRCLHAMHLRLLPLFPLLSAALVSSKFTPKDLLSAPRTSPAIPNPNGTFAVYTQQTYSFENDTRSGGLFLIPIALREDHEDTPESSGTESDITPLWLVNSTAVSDPQWISDSSILYIHTGDAGSSLRVRDIDSGEETVVEKFDAEIENLKVLRGKNNITRIAFSAKVNRRGEMVPVNETSIPDVLVYDKLWVRHWDTWITPLRNAIFSGILSPSPDTADTLTSTSSSLRLHGLRNMLSGHEIHDLESPIPPFGDSSDFSLSEKYMAFVAKDPHLNPATNTASHVYVVSYDDEEYIEQVNRGQGASSAPVWSPDGEEVAFLEMRVRGYESDRMDPLIPRNPQFGISRLLPLLFILFVLLFEVFVWSLIVGRRVVVFKWKTHEYTYLTETWDRSPQSILWSQDGKSLYLTTEDQGHLKLFYLSLPSASTASTATTTTSNTPKPVITKHSLTGAFWATPSTLLITQSSLTSPSFISLYSPRKSTLHPLFAPSASLGLSASSVREFWFPGFNTTPVHGFIYLPENFDDKKKYRMAFLIHGGPQGAWEDAWSTRWNPAVFANAGEVTTTSTTVGDEDRGEGDGWVVVAINPTGSTGYGQNFTDAIQGNWGTIPCKSPPPSLIPTFPVLLVIPGGVLLLVCGCCMHLRITLFD